MFIFNGHSNKINAIVSLNKQRFATGSQDFQILVWDTSICGLHYKFDSTNGGHSNAITVLASIDDGSIMASGSSDCSIKIWDLTQGSLKFTFDKTNGGHYNWISSLAYLGNGLLASGSDDSSIKV